ncbi:hypothetical protein ASPSYDRAFT_28236 [Aspergillus sydowii CBS 593.65]|uniref:CENP-V/GFA domain-containing protein n=1 Tax=Aspergillus sydowii CBS 593.65 TaxID=1036612 RepID=A0A1L9TTA4_9EURO|nr:uncharacterized protein ASPSYDRAFT_28236 [Aspergillus sydowii CBS 593.65]OJJ62605.1 hypothetical protein ASPSYDRAFT_28236 [Aspergillus sydowii CBS 593.65]
MAPHIKGACLCEGVQFEVHGDPESVFICYCAHCSKNAGAPGQISAKFKKEQVEVEQGEELTKIWTLSDNLSGSDKHKVFCSQCGCTLWTIPMKHGGSHLIVRTSLLEEGTEFFASKKVETASESIKSFARMPGH